MSQSAYRFSSILKESGPPTLKYSPSGRYGVSYAREGTKCVYDALEQTKHEYTDPIECKDEYWAIISDSYFTYLSFDEEKQLIVHDLCVLDHGNKAIKHVFRMTYEWNVVSVEFPCPILKIGTREYVLLRGYVDMGRRTAESIRLIPSDPTRVDDITTRFNMDIDVILAALSPDNTLSCSDMVLVSGSCLIVVTDKIRDQEDFAFDTSKIGYISIDLGHILANHVPSEDSRGTCVINSRMSGVELVECTLAEGVAAPVLADNDMYHYLEHTIYGSTMVSMDGGNFESVKETIYITDLKKRTLRYVTLDIPAQNGDRNIELSIHPNGTAELYACVESEGDGDDHIVVSTIRTGLLGVSSLKDLCRAKILQLDQDRTVCLKYKDILFPDDTTSTCTRSDLADRIFLGACTAAEVCLRMLPNQLRLFYLRRDEDLDVSLPLYLAYKSNRGEMYHFPMTREDGKWMVCFNVGNNQGFKDLDALILFYEDWLCHNPVRPTEWEESSPICDKNLDVCPA